MLAEHAATASYAREEIPNAAAEEAEQAAASVERWVREERSVPAVLWRLIDPRPLLPGADNSSRSSDG